MMEGSLWIFGSVMIAGVSITLGYLIAVAVGRMRKNKK